MPIQPLVCSFEARIERCEGIVCLEIQRDLYKVALSHITDIGKRTALSS